MEWFPGWLESKALRFLHHSTLGSRVIKEKKKSRNALGWTHLRRLLDPLHGRISLRTPTSGTGKCRAHTPLCAGHTRAGRDHRNCRGDEILLVKYRSLFFIFSSKSASWYKQKITAHGNGSNYSILAKILDLGQN